jgi:hypothetical protein
VNGPRDVVFRGHRHRCPFFRRRPLLPHPTSFALPLCQLQLLQLQPSIMEAVQQLAPYQQQEFVKEMEKLQLKDSLT